MENVEIELITYDKDNLKEKKNAKIDTCFQAIKENQVTWINIVGIHDPEVMTLIGRTFYLHSLAMEDVMNTEQRPKVEEFENFLFTVVKMLSFDDDKQIQSEQVSFALGENFLISFQERDGDVFDPIRERIRESGGKVRSKGNDYLFHLLLDVIIDNYYTIIDEEGNKIEALEDSLILDNAEDDVLHVTQKMKKELIQIRKAAFPIRDGISFIEKGESEFIKEENIKYFRDCYDHIMSVTEMIDHYRDTLNSVKDLYHSNLSNRMNQIMKVLTIMASIFIPLTFIAGIYGMNFKYIPELEMDNGYVYVWILMLLVTAGMVYYFRKKKWM